MRRHLVALLAAALATFLLALSPTTGAGEDSSTTTDPGTESTLITPAPEEVTLYFHGAGDRGLDEDQWLEGPPPMDRNEPTADDFESKQLLNYVIGPNDRCAGNGLWPIWLGYVGGGTLVGEATVTFTVVGGTGGKAVVNLWNDVSGQACNEAYPEPDATAEVTLPIGVGEVEVTVPVDGLRPDFQLLLQLQPASDGPAGLAGPTNQGRVLYDGSSYPSSITFTCQPDDVDTEEEAATADCDPLS